MTLLPCFLPCYESNEACAPSSAVENLEGRLRLRWTCPETGKKRKNLALGLNDGISGRGEAARVKAWIETDAQHGYYDPTLTKYLPQKKRQQVTGITTVELFDRFTQYQSKHEGLSKASIETRYKYLKVMLEKHLNIPAADIDRGAIDGFLLVCRKIKPDTAKQRIWLLKAAWDWGRDKFQLPDLNPWEGVAERFKSVPVQPVPAFSTDEVKRILDGFRNSPHYANYLDYVRFRLSMATRPQEVRDLKWKHISADFGSAWFASNKTKKGRTVPLDPSIASMLSTRRDLLKPASDDELVFTSREGLPIDNGNFRRLWRIVLAKDKSGLITATVISKKGIARSETPQYRRDLLQMAVEQGYASSNGKHPNHNKYGIYFNDKNRVKVIVEKTFDPSVLNSENFIDLPPHSLKNGLNIKEIESWNAHQKYWLSVYQLLCGFQIEGKINLELLPAWYYPDLKGEISLRSRELIVIYKILKLGTSELENYFSLGESGYNIIFQKILQNRSVHLLKKSRIETIDRPRTQLYYLRELRDRKAELSAIDREILSRNFLGNNFDISRQIHLDKKHTFGNYMFIEYMFEFTQNSDIKKLGSPAYMG